MFYVKFIFLGMTINKSRVLIMTDLKLLFNFAADPSKASLQIFIYWLSALDIPMFNEWVENIKLLKISHLIKFYILSFVDVFH